MEDLAEIRSELSSWCLTKLMYAFNRRGTTPDLNEAEQLPTLRTSTILPPSLSPGARIVLSIIGVAFLATFLAFLWSVHP